MPGLTYAAPTSVDDAVKLLAGSSGLAKVLSGRNRPFGANAVRPAEAGPDRRHQEDPGDHRHPRGRRRLRRRRRHARRGGRSACRHEHGMAGRGRGARPDRLDAGAGPLLAGRQSVQCLARRRQRSGAVSPPARSRSSSAAKASREMPVEQMPTGPGRTSLAKDEFILEFKFPPRPARSGDAYLRFIPRTEMDIAVVGCGISVTLDDKGVCTAARVALGAVAPTVLLVHGCRRRADRPHARRRHAGQARQGGAGRVQTDQRQARNDRIPHQGRRRARAPRRADRVRSAHPANHCKGSLTMAKTYVSTTINGESAEFLCETAADPAGRAARRRRPDRQQGRLRLGRLRRLLGDHRRPPGLLLPRAGRRSRGQDDHHDRGHRPGREAASGAAEVPGACGAAMRLLHARA